MLLYKFFAPERLDVLQDAMIRLTQPAALNDPFDCRPRNYELDELPRIEIEGHVECVRAHVDEVQTTMTQEERKAVGLLCLSEDPANIAMWAHYAAQHTGFVLGFDSTHEFFAKRADGTGLWKVRYSDIRPHRPLNVVLDDLQRQPGPHNLGLISYHFPSMPTFNPDTYPDDYRFVKSRCWEYEKEWRLLRTFTQPNRTIEQGNRLPVHLFHFPPDCLKSVIVGIRNFSFLYPRIREILDSSQYYSHVRVYAAERHHSTFALDIEQFEPPRDVSPAELNGLPLEVQVAFFRSKGILKELDEIENRLDPDSD